MAIGKKTNKSSKRSSVSVAGSHILTDVLSLAVSVANSQKDGIVARLNIFVDSTNEYLASLETAVPLGGQFESATDRLHDFTAYIKKTDIADILDDANNYARRNPWETFAWALASGALMYTYYRNSGSIDFGLPEKNGIGSGSKRKPSKRSAKR